VTEPPSGGLQALIEASAADLEAADRRDGNSGAVWSTRGIVFAAANDDRAEFRLARPVVAAALRTPDTAPSDRGPDWVAFAPSELDGHAIDRAVAWLTSAWRRAHSES
jgi:hypothetical protein